MRCPQGKKVKLYKRAKLEKFAHYLMKDGLVSRLSVYEDRECKYRIKVSWKPIQPVFHQISLSKLSIVIFPGTSFAVLDLIQTKEFYANRQDKLKERIHNQRTGWITEFYHPGRNRSLRGQWSLPARYLQMTIA